MGRYDGEDYERLVPCRGTEHNFALNGSCWKCRWTRSELAALVPAPIVVVEEGTDR